MMQSAPHAPQKKARNRRVAIADRCFAWRIGSEAEAHPDAVDRLEETGLPRIGVAVGVILPVVGRRRAEQVRRARSEEHTSELQSLMRISYAGFCLKKKNDRTNAEKQR